MVALFFRLGLIAALAVHGWFTVQMFWSHGYWGAFPPFDASNTTQIFSDLFVAVALINLWVYFDVRRRGLPLFVFFVHVAGTVATGSFAPLLYLLFRPSPLFLAANDASTPC